MNIDQSIDDTCSHRLELRISVALGVLQNAVLGLAVDVHLGRSTFRDIFAHDGNDPFEIAILALVSSLPLLELRQCNEEVY